MITDHPEDIRSNFINSIVYMLAIKYAYTSFEYLYSQERVDSWVNEGYIELLERHTSYDRIQLTELGQSIYFMERL